MRRAFTCSLFFLAFLLAAIGCGSGGDLSKPETQREFGVRMAKMNLWREAMFRFRREVQIAPENAMAHNNLAVALEATGDFDGAAKEYREALKLDRTNEFIQKNYSRFVEFTQKAKKRDAQAVKAAAGSAGERLAPTTPATTATASPTTVGVPAEAPDRPRPPAPPVSDTTATTTTNPPTTTTNPPGGPR
ncbi:MAG TPA: tetratricopeptide repeat protein [Thermoanaerobaculia bacterium]|nr:tetratricopeptide repeat protein [Thermoanaerobaculia bacterium]